jgi:hypothetical protein
MRIESASYSPLLIVLLAVHLINKVLAPLNLPKDLKVDMVFIIL